MHRNLSHLTAHQNQRGVVLLITLIILIAMTMAAVAMVRSVDTANIIAGNLAFRQATTHSADAGIEEAIRWLETVNGSTTLNANSDENGYVDHMGLTDSPTGTQNWVTWWDAYCGTIVTCKDFGTDAVGNRIQYVIHRLCKNSGSSSGNECTASITKVSSGNSDEALKEVLISKTQIYYRVTAKVSGPKNSISFIQATVAL